jgi:hypothetical protein
VRTCVPKFRRNLPLPLLFAAFCLTFASDALGQTNTVWAPGITGNWSSSADWSSGVPNGNYNALISNGQPGISVVNLNMNATVAGLTLDNGDSLNLLAGRTLKTASATPQTLNLNGTLTIDSGAGFAVGSGDTLSNSGTIQLAGSGSSIKGITGSETLVNAGTIEGHGTISGLSIENNGFIDASGGTLVLDPGSLGISGSNFAVEGGSTLKIIGAMGFFDPVTRTISNVGLDVKGTLQLESGDIRGTSGFAGVTLDGPNAKIVDQSGHNALASGMDLNDGGLLTVTNGATLKTGALSTNADAGGQILISNGSLVKASSVSIEGPNGQLSLTNSAISVTGGVHVCCGDVGSSFDALNSRVTIGGSVDLSSPQGLSGGFAATNSTVKIGGDLKDTGDLFLGAGFSFDTSMVRVGGNVLLNQKAAGEISASNLLVQKDIQLTASGEALTHCPDLCPQLEMTNGSKVTADGLLNSNGSLTLDSSSTLTVKHGFTQSGGTSVIDGSLHLGSPGMDLEGGTLSGTGTIFSNLKSSGVVSPGDAMGTLSITRNFTQTTSGTLLEQVGWLGGTEASSLDVFGKAGLGGTLDIMLASGYLPKPGDSFTLLTASSVNGTFTAYDGLSIGSGLDWVVFYDPHDVRVVAEAVPGARATPEPGSFLLLLAGLAALALLKLRR